MRNSFQYIIRTKARGEQDVFYALFCVRKYRNKKNKCKGWRLQDISKSRYYYPDVVGRVFLTRSWTQFKGQATPQTAASPQTGEPWLFIPVTHLLKSTWSSEGGREWGRKGQVKELYHWEPGKSQPTRSLFLMVSSVQQGRRVLGEPDH